MGWLARLAQSVRGLAGLGDGPMGPSPRVIYIYKRYSSPLVHHLDQPTGQPTESRSRAPPRETEPARLCEPKPPCMPTRAESFPREPIASACPEPIDPVRAEASPCALTYACQSFSISAQSFYDFVSHSCYSDFSHSCYNS
jgi:hypothetical protein